MKTDNELLILGIKARQRELNTFWNELKTDSSIDLNSFIDMTNLIEAIEEYRKLEHKLSQIDPNYYEIPF